VQHVVHGGVAEQDEREVRPDLGSTSRSIRSSRSTNMGWTGGGAR
jgi:hypothetical protein